ncbi:hypothetical protein [Leptothoe sp. PORK10 BA2]|uniref:hypothetical protein n=1 Tax=Leptothoe sp. PORK10 BA2 TaxID=3110254 RepID=UPI002B1F4220|nr:hypothetical protein [Leptothoe sp. PORK10 BA2]MEA5466151.1 hypothetical protein [Leptothoe sp. PORK10 BA2]
MMPSFLNFFQRIYISFGRAKSSKPSKLYPENLVRLCRNRVDFITIINEAIHHPNQSWDQELVDRIIQFVLEKADSGVSVYSSATLDPLDHGHAFAVVAEGMSQSNFRSTKGSKRKSSCTRGSLIIPISCLPKTTYYDFTPKNNLDFYPANQHHFDLTINDVEELAVALLDGIKQGSIAWSILGNDGKFTGSYRLQAAIAYSHCLQAFGKLNPSAPPSDWIDGKTVTASEQIDTLKYLAQTVAVDSPNPNS